MNTDERRDNGQILRAVGELTGMVKTMSEAHTRRLDDIRADIARLEKSSNDRMDRMESALNRRIDDVSAGLRAMDEGVGKRIDGLSGRVTTLEAGEKKLIGQVARMSALGGGIGGSLVAAAVEVLKRF